MSDKLKIAQEKIYDNVIHVPPRLYKITYLGLHGTIEYHPSSKDWSYKLKLIHPTTHDGKEKTEEAAVLALKKLIQQVANGKNRGVKSVD